MSDELREQLAEAQHAIWSHWMKYLFSQCAWDSAGRAVIPAEFVQRWQRQMDTQYGDLTEQERESDREQADTIILAIRHVLEAAALAEVYGPRAEEAEAALAAVPRQAIDALFRQQFGSYPVWFNEAWTPIADWLGYKPARR